MLGMAFAGGIIVGHDDDAFVVEEFRKFIPPCARAEWVGGCCNTVLREFSLHVVTVLFSFEQKGGFGSNEFRQPIRTPFAPFFHPVPSGSG